MTECPKHEGYRIGAMGRKRVEAGVAEGAGPTRSGVGREGPVSGDAGVWAGPQSSILEPLGRSP